MKHFIYKMIVFIIAVIIIYEFTIGKQISQFTGKNKIEQHKMVYNSLKGKMGNELHALAIKTKEQ